MNEIDYNVEYRRLKDSTFEEVLADPQKNQKEILLGMLDKK